MKRIGYIGGLSQSQLGKLMGVSQSAVQKWEKIGGLSPKNRKKIIDFFGEDSITARRVHVLVGMRIAQAKRNVEDKTVS